MWVWTEAKLKNIHAYTRPGSPSTQITVEKVMSKIMYSVFLFYKLRIDSHSALKFLANFVNKKLRLLLYLSTMPRKHMGKWSKIHSFNFSTTQSWLVSFTFQPPYPIEKPQYPLNMRLKCRSVHSSKAKKPCWELNSDNPAHSHKMDSVLIVSAKCDKYWT